MRAEHRNRSAAARSLDKADSAAPDAERDARRRRCADHFVAAYRLTAAEAEIAAALADGARARQIAQVRAISMNTLRAQRRTAYAKLGVADQVELVHALPRLWPQE